MADATAPRVNRNVWVDLSSSDPAASRAFYASLFGWQVDVNPDPIYGGYAIATIGDKQVAGIGSTQSADQPTVWSIYIGTSDAAATDEKVKVAGGTVVAPAFDVGNQGRMAVLQDPSGAFISTWEENTMRPFLSGVPNTFGWAELNARGLEKAVRFYGEVFGWTTETSPMGEGLGDYTTFKADGEPIAGGMEMNPMVPAEVPSYWMPYFNIDDVDASYAKALELGAHEMVSPSEFPGGRFAIVGDAQGAVFGLLKQG